MINVKEILLSCTDAASATVRVDGEDWFLVITVLRYRNDGKRVSYIS